MVDDDSLRCWVCSVLERNCQVVNCAASDEPSVANLYLLDEQALAERRTWLQTLRQDLRPDTPCHIDPQRA